MSRASREGSRQLGAKTDKVRAARGRGNINGPFALMHFTRQTHRRDRVARRDPANARARASTRALNPAPSLSKRVTRLGPQGEFKRMAQGYAERPAAHVARPREARLAHSLRISALAAAAKDAKPAEAAARAATPGVEPVRAARRDAWRAWQKDQPRVRCRRKAPGRSPRAPSATGFSPSTPLFRVTCPGGLGVPSRDRRGGARATA